MPITNVDVIALTGYRLPEEAELRRDYTRPPERRSDYYIEAYDNRTVYYDCVYLPRPGGYLFTAPRFLNLWEPFRSGLRLNGKSVNSYRRVKWLRCEQVFVPGARGRLTLEIAGRSVEVDVRDSIAPEFAGLNTLVAVSKNNRLDWIQNWVRFHAVDHGTQGVVIFDNGSTDYTVDELAGALTETGVTRAVVYSAPFPYGPADKSGRFDVSPRFFQSAMLNLARRDALASTRAVLSIDIDELVIGEGPGSIYDLAAQHPLGMVTIDGSWVFPPDETEGPVAQPAHVFRADPNKKCNRKWCMTTQGLMSRVFGWAVHQIGGVAQNIFTTQRSFSLIHCRACSTGWKKNRFRFPDKMRRDPELVTLMERHFSDAALSTPEGSDAP